MCSSDLPPSPHRADLLYGQLLAGRSGDFAYALSVLVHPQRHDLLQGKVWTGVVERPLQLVPDLLPVSGGTHTHTHTHIRLERPGKGGRTEKKRELSGEFPDEEIQVLPCISSFLCSISFQGCPCQHSGGFRRETATCGLTGARLVKCLLQVGHYHLTLTSLTDS